MFCQFVNRRNGSCFAAVPGKWEVLPGEGTGRSPLQLPEKSKKGRTAAFFPGAAYPSSATMMELESRKPRSVSAMRSSPARSRPARCIGDARRSRAV